MIQSVELKHRAKGFFRVNCLKSEKKKHKKKLWTPEVPLAMCLCILTFMSLVPLHVVKMVAVRANVEGFCKSSFLFWVGWGVHGCFCFVCLFRSMSLWRFKCTVHVCWLLCSDCDSKIMWLCNIRYSLLLIAGWSTFWIVLLQIWVVPLLRDPFVGQALTRNSCGYFKIRRP